MEYEVEVNTTGNSFQVDVSLANYSGGNGGNSDLITIAGLPLSGGRVVAIREGKAVYFDPEDPDFYGSVCGITKTSAAEGDSVSVQMSGIFYESGLGLIADSLYYVGLNGTLITDPSGLKIMQPLGVSIDENKLKINIQNSIETI